MRLMIDLMVASNAEHIRSLEELQKDHEILYWIRMENVAPFDHARFPQTIFHDYHDAVRGIGAKKIDASAFESWDPDSIAALAKWEMIFLVMMDKWYPHWPVTKRYDFYYELLRYWGGLLDQLMPDAVIFNGPPHHMYNLVLYMLAKERGIKTVLFDVTFRMDRAQALKDFTKGNDVLARAARDGFPGPSIELGDLPHYAQEYYREVTGSSKPSPQHFTAFNKEHVWFRVAMRRLKGLYPFLKDGSIFERAISRMMKKMRLNSKDEYLRLQQPADLSIPFVYFPLHYQPECTTSPQGGIFVDQIHLIRMLATALPQGWEIFVKEHPAQWPAHLGDFTPQRYHDFYVDIASIPGVRLVPVATNTFKLADRAQATATVSGTAAWESVLRGKCAIISGYPWFMHAPGLLRVADVGSCRQAFTTIQSGTIPDRQEIFKYFALMDSVSFPSHLDVMAYTVRAYPPGVESQAMLDVLREALAAE